MKRAIALTVLAVLGRSGVLYACLFSTYTCSVLGTYSLFLVTLTSRLVFAFLSPVCERTVSDDLFPDSRVTVVEVPVGL